MRKKTAEEAREKAERKREAKARGAYFDKGHPRSNQHATNPSARRHVRDGERKMIESRKA